MRTVATAAMQNSGDGCSVFLGLEALPRRPLLLGEVSAGSGRSKDPSGVSAGNNPSHDAYPTSLQRSGGYSLANKDQCRSVASGVDVPVALVVDEVVPLQSDHDRKLGADP